ncbi:MAG TPA: type II toxin-antitoxin system RelE/ParE family toxin [Gemmataceae bacterium]|nr:type II toxin-antitoxin system RelE/ParE family toxin [Gemmataceae bacterium]
MATSFRVELSPRARADAEAIHDHIAQSRPKAAEKWLREFHAKLRALRTMPLLYEIIPEIDVVGSSYRHFEHKNYRIIYRVEERAVVVVRVFRAARRLTLEMLQE